LTSSPDTIAPAGFLAVRRSGSPALARLVVRTLVRRAARHGAGSLRLIEEWPGHRRETTYGTGEPQAQLIVRERDAYAALAFGGSRGLGRSYVNGAWDSEDLTSLVRVLFRATQPLRRRLDAWARLVEPLRRRGRTRPSREADRENIHAHYDLSNDFFALMLDETMAYSCAVFVDEATSLHDAQVEKFDRICRKLGLSASDHVLEIGTGWGGFAVHAASRYGARVTTTTISAEQRAGAIERVAAAGLSHLVTVLDEHYADLTGTYDAIVSIEMIEAVSWRQYEEFMAACARLLSERGRVALQAITIVDQSFDRAKRHDDFIRDLIFPGGCLPSVSALVSAATRASDLRLVDLEDIGPHYARTLDLWRRNVHANDARVRALGFDDRFLRLWDLYLGYCEAAFLERHISDVQMVLHRPATPAGPRAL
jgi:cyclopropane-fatty-acyl-phospholipid synthase